jgi:glycosyltransferase involved in cell wall biosynthesis
MRVAIVHDWLVTYAGAERVLEQMIRVLPQAELFSLVDFLPAPERDFIQGKSVTTSFVQRLPQAKSGYRRYLPLMPLAIEQFDLSSYDIVISSSYAVAKGVITGPDQLHICMCYSPIRYAWDLQHQYLRESGLEHGLKGWATRALLHYVRNWDARTSNGVDAYIAISDFIRRRIRKVYRRDSTVIYPPVDTSAYELWKQKDDFYLTASRLVPYKKVDLIVRAFAAMPDKRLVVIGDGPDFEKVRSRAGPNIELLGYQPFEVLRDRMQRAKAFVFAAEEDFGIVPVEAQACGTPVIAYGKGGVLETVRGLECDAPTGVFFETQTSEALATAVVRFEREATRFSPASIRDNALHFCIKRFRNEFLGFVEAHLEAFREQRC